MTATRSPVSFNNGPLTAEKLSEKLVENGSEIGRMLVKHERNGRTKSFSFEVGAEFAFNLLLKKSDGGNAAEELAKHR